VIADAAPRPFWLDHPDAPDLRPPLEGAVHADVVVIGGGLTGLWTALLAAEDGKRVVLLETERLAFGASGRNGGFCAASLTHGLENGRARWPDEMDTLERLARENFAGIRDTVARHGIDCGWEETGTIDVATAPHQLSWLQDGAEQLRRFGWNAEILDRDDMRAEVNSPTYAGGLLSRDGCALVDPVRLWWGLARAAEAAGAVICEGSPVRALAADGAGVRADTPGGRVLARRALLATSAFPPLVRAIRRYVVAVYDYVLVTEPLSASQREAIGWRGRQGLSDVTNQFHYYRLTSDDRILWGGYDAIYDFRGGVGPQREQREATFSLLAGHFYTTFPQLEGIRFTHRWGGAIDTCTRFAALWGRALAGRAVYVVGFTGLGVGASRFGARVGLDLLDGLDTERTRLEMVRRRPLPFPPEPARWLGIQLTRRALARADERAGRRGPWLRTLDRFGLGFDS
jgi:glycine/D-amino acid oxidase-like deaminating enzyme